MDSSLVPVEQIEECPKYASSTWLLLTNLRIGLVHIEKGMNNRVNQTSSGAFYGLSARAMKFSPHGVLCLGNQRRRVDP